MKHLYRIKTRDYTGKIITATVNARRTTTAVRRVLDFAQTSFSSIQSIRRLS